MRWINVKAVAWAFETDKVHSKEERAVLLSLAAPADERGYTWPGKGNMASTWFMHHETVANVIKALLVRRALFPTKKRRGDTRQVEVYRLPKCARSSYERCLQTEPSANDKDSPKVRERFGKGIFKPTGTKEQGIKNNSEKKAEDDSLLSLGNGPLAVPIGSFFSSLASPKEERQEPAWFYEIRGMYPGTTVDKDLKQIEEWARKNRKEFNRDLALNALRRNPPKKPGQSDGYVYQGKFIGNKKANALAIKDPILLLNAKRAIRHANGRVEIL